MSSPLAHRKRQILGVLAVLGILFLGGFYYLDTEKHQSVFLMDSNTVVSEIPQTISEYSEETPQSSRRNVLFLMADDLRSQLGCYQGHEGSLVDSPRMVTPHIDQLASTSLLLRRAYVQYSLCGPSRTSMLTSRRPDATHITNNKVYWRESANFTTLPQFFKQQGYNTVGVGKIFHMGQASGFSDPISWTHLEPDPFNSDKSYMNTYGGQRWVSVSPNESDAQPLIDQVLVKTAKRLLREVAPKAQRDEQPFFLALGFRKPHAAYICPERFFDLYEMERPGEYLTPEEIVSSKVPDQTLREYRRAYAACISYVDSLVGEILGTLTDLGLADSTVVSLVSDHGYMFGDHGGFGKSLIYDIDSRVPMMIRVPGETDRGVVSDTVVEALDLFPTLVEAAGLRTVPKCKSGEDTSSLCTHGKSLIPLIRGNGTSPSIVGQAVTQAWSRETQHAMEYSLILKDVSYKTVVSPPGDGPVVVGRPVETGLFWYTDPGTDNSTADVVAELHARLEQIILDMAT